MAEKVLVSELTESASAAASEPELPDPEPDEPLLPQAAAERTMPVVTAIDAITDFLANRLK
jgi:hypothetical protein